MKRKYAFKKAAKPKVEEHDWIETMQARLMLDVVSLSALLESDRGERAGDILLGGKHLHVTINRAVTDLSVGQWVQVIDKPKKRKGKK